MTELKKFLEQRAEAMHNNYLTCHDDIGSEIAVALRNEYELMFKFVERLEAQKRAAVQRRMEIIAAGGDPDCEG